VDLIYLCGEFFMLLLVQLTYTLVLYRCYEVPMNTLTRRHFLEKSVLTGAALGCGGSSVVSMLGLPENSPQLKFPTTPRERLAVATWPFRAFIESPENEYRDKSQPGMDLRDFTSNVRTDFGVPGVEPLSSHFAATEESYLRSFRQAIDKAGVHVVNIPVDNSYSYYDADPAVRKKAVDNGKKWVDAALIIGSPSVRTSIAEAKNAKPDVNVVAEQLRQLVDYATSKNILVNLENDNLVSEDAFFIVKVIEKVQSPYLRALPDFCNSMQTGNEKFNYDAVTTMFRHAYNICHVKDSEVGENGKVFRVDLKKTFDILKASNYRGYLSMEWEGQGSSYDGTRHLIAASLQYLA
jgi:sugar phosphate isomerase/epimerase